MQELTKAEETIMYCIWKLGNNVCTTDIMTCLKENYGKEYVNTTLCVFMSYLRKKKYVGYHKHGNTYLYYPLVTRQEYRKRQIEQLLNGCFEGSVVALFKTIILNASEDEKKLILKLMAEQE